MNTDRPEFPNFRFYAELPSLKGWDKAFQSKEKKRYPAKTVILKQGQKVNHLFYIVSGLVEYTYTRDWFICRFGGLRVSLMSTAELRECMRRQPELAEEMLSELAKIIGGLIRQLHSQTFKAERRVEEVICLLAEYKKRRAGGNGPIVVPLSQDDLARITRTTRVTVTKVCGELKKRA